MAYTYNNSKNKTYFLHARETTLRNGKQQPIYFFARELQAGVLNEVPAGYLVVETRTGLPVLKKK